MTLDILQFAIDTQHYGLPLAGIVEVVRAVAITRLPQAPRVVEGIIDVRGRVVPVLNLRARFRHAPRALDPSQHFILTRAGDRIVAMRVDQALDIVRLDASVVEPLADAVRRSAFVAGVAKVPGGVILIHDPAVFLSESESEALDDALSRAEDHPSRNSE